jgi:hypothetical protein
VTTLSDTTTTTHDETSGGPAPDLVALGRLIGNWKVSDPSGQGAVDGQVRYEWFDGGFFLVQHVDLVQSGQRTKGIEIIGHERGFGASAPGEDLVSRYYDTAGNTFDYVYELEGDTLTIWGGGKGSPAYFRGTFDDRDVALTGAWVWPGGGYQATMRRIVVPAPSGGAADGDGGPA